METIYILFREEAIMDIEARIKIMNYINKEGYISPEFENVGLSYTEILNMCEYLTKIGVLRKRDCAGLAYEFNKKEK